MTEEQYKNYRARRMLDAVAMRSVPLNTPQEADIKTSRQKASPGKAKTGTKAISKIEELLAVQIKAAGLPAPVREFRYIPGRKFRLDFAWPYISPPFGVEVQGHVHRIKARFEADIEKRIFGLMAGWRIAEVSGASIRSGVAIQWISHLLNGGQQVQKPRSKH